jgi:regulator of protease activity HflC (stomatin/prohibitin superfamily)
MLALATVLAIAGIASAGLGPLLTLSMLMAAGLTAAGLTLVNPNHSKVLVFFGRYVGTIKQPGLWWVNPLTYRKSVSLRVNNFNSVELKVNDLRGNPVEIATVVVWRVENTAQAAFDVEDYSSFVEVQTESALRTIAAKHSYDAADVGQTSLRGDSAEINVELQQAITDRLSMAGVQVLEARISHLAYAPEIAGAMLRRQQAEAIIDARARIVEGAVSMVEMALDRLKDREVIEMSDAQKASMVSNLMVVLCSESEATPVVSTGNAA